MKECSKCKQTKPLDQFSTWASKSSGKQLVSSKCKACTAEYSRNRYSAKRDELRQQLRDYYAKNRESALQKAKDYYDANKEKVLKGRRKNYEANRSVVLIRCAEWKAKNPEKVKVAQRRWTESNREKVRASANKYARANRARVAERWMVMRLMVMEAYGGAHCACCGESTYEFLTIDHIDNDGAKHRAAIGSHLYRWLIENDFPEGFQVLCMNCNWGKHRNGGICPHKDHERSTTIPTGSRAKRPEKQGAPLGR